MNEPNPLILWLRKLRLRSKSESYLMTTTRSYQGSMASHISPYPTVKVTIISCLDWCRSLLSSAPAQSPTHYPPHKGRSIQQPEGCSYNRRQTTPLLCSVTSDVFPSLLSESPSSRHLHVYPISSYLSFQPLHPSYSQQFLHILHPGDCALVIPSASSFFQISK